MTNPSFVKTLHKPAMDLAAAEAARIIKCEDLRMTDAATLYAIVIKHWQKCEPCAQLALLLSNCKAVSDAATFMVNLHGNDLIAVA